MLLAFAFSLSTAWAGQVLLDCNIPDGSDQQIQVVQSQAGLTLRELTTIGRWIERPLSQEEWKSNGLKLHENDPQTVTTLWATPHGWWVESNSPGFKITAPADCGL
jgi:hypothetical protein